MRLLRSMSSASLNRSMSIFMQVPFLRAGGDGGDQYSQFRPGWHRAVQGAWSPLAVSFHQVVHPVRSGEAGVAKRQHLLGGPDERSSECPADAAQSSRPGAAGGGEGQTPTAAAAAFGVTGKTPRQGGGGFPTEGGKRPPRRSSPPPPPHTPPPA